MERNNQPAENPRTELEKRNQLFGEFWTLIAKGWEARARSEQKRLDRLRSIDTSAMNRKEWIIDALEGLASAYQGAAEAWKAIAVGGVLDMTEAEARELAEDFGDKEYSARVSARYKREFIVTMAQGSPSRAVFEEEARCFDKEEAAWQKVQSFLTAYADVQAAGSWDQVD